MKIMYFPQPSVRSYKTGLWHLESCSMMVRMRSIVYHMPSSWEWMWMVPPKTMQSSNSSDVFPLDAQITEIPWEADVHSNRFTFPVEEVEIAARKYKPDVVYTECVEHVTPLKFALMRAGCDAKVIAQIGYVPMHTHGYKVLPDPLPRQVDGASEADHLTFNSDVERHAWFKIAIDNGYIVEDLKNKVTELTGLFDPDDVKCERDEGRDMRKELSGKDGIPRIFYAGRFSDPERTRYIPMLEALTRLAGRGKKFKTWVGDPNQAVSGLAKMVPNYSETPYDIPFSRKEYLKTLWAADIVPILIPNRTAGFCEAVEAENLVITADRIGKLDSSGVSTIDGTLPDDEFTDALEVELGNMIDYFHDTPNEKIKSKFRRQERWVTKYHAVHRQADAIREMFESFAC